MGGKQPLRFVWVQWRPPIGDALGLQLHRVGHSADQVRRLRVGMGLVGMLVLAGAA